MKSNVYSFGVREVFEDEKIACLYIKDYIDIFGKKDGKMLLNKQNNIRVNSWVVVKDGDVE